ncbi:zinc finger, CCHC-type containing protein, partial [Tanacetum coccineum]
MATAAMKHMASSFAKLEKFEGDDGGENPTVEQVRKRAKWDNDGYAKDTLEAKYMAEDASSKKFLVSNFINYKMKDSRPVLEQYNELLGILGRFTQHKMNMDESIQEELTLIELGSHLRIEESLRAQDNDKPKGNIVAGPSVVNMVERNNSSRYNDNKGKRKHRDTRANPNKKLKVTCWKCGKSRHLKKNCKGGNVGNRANRSSTKGSEDGSSNPLKGQSMFNKSHQIYYVTYVSEAFFMQDDDVAWWVDSGATVHVCKDRCWFKTYESLNDGSILHMGNESTALVHGRGCVDLRLNIVSDNIGSAFMSTSKLNDSILWHARLGHVHFKRMQDMSNDGLIPAFDMDTEKCQTCMLNKITKKPFQNVKRETKVLELIHSDLCDLHATPSLGNKKAVVRLPDPKLKTLGERGIECIFVRYAEHSKAFRFYVSSVPRPSQRSLVKGTENSGGSVVSERVIDEIVQQSEPRKSKRHRTPKDFGPEFQLYLVEGTRDEVSNQHSYSFNVEDNPKTFNEAMKSEDVAFWKEAINDEMDSIIGNNTWVLTDLPPGCRPLGCKWIFKRKLKVDGTVEKFKASLIIHQMDVKTAFLNEELEEEAPKQWHQKFDEVVLSNGYLLNQANKCVCSKFNASGKGVIICLYVDDMLIFGTDQVQVDLTKEFLSSRFSIKDMGEADVILGIRVKHESNGIEISQSHYIEKVLKKFNYSDCTPVSTPLDTCEKLMPNKG